HSVIENLQKHGDLLEIARPGHHWIYFKSKHDRVIFIKMIEPLGFEVVQQNKVKEREDFPYQLQISRIDQVHHQAIDACTLQIQELAQQSNAEYDGWETQVIRN
ncbi:ribonuclease E inhibitor RraB, partial [Acinetobacter seifertii]|uniref:ribonuclease E inhibitor RraB n=1 Tax=Acinetobacter seifertii TaxID=1530123 RepID=UPI001580B61C